MVKPEELSPVVNGALKSRTIGLKANISPYEEKKEVVKW